MTQRVAGASAAGVVRPASAPASGGRPEIVGRGAGVACMPGLWRGDVTPRRTADDRPLKVDQSVRGFRGPGRSENLTRASSTSTSIWAGRPP